MLNACIWVNRSRHRVAAINIPKMRPKGLEDHMLASKAKKIMQSNGWGEPTVVQGILEDVLYFTKAEAEVVAAG